MKHNEKMSSMSPLMPRVYKELMRYECLSSSHYNTVLRLAKDGAASPGGDISKAARDDLTFKADVEMGHRWIILPASVSNALRSDVVQWKHVGQNQDQTLTDGDIIRMALVVVDKFVSAAKERGADVARIPLPGIVGGVVNGTPVSLNPNVAGGYSRFVTGMCEDRCRGLVQKFLDFWSVHVTPKLLMIPHTFFENMGKAEAFKKMPYLRLEVAQSMYTHEGAIPRTRPTPDSCGFITAGDITSLSKTPKIAELINSCLEGLHNKLMPILSRFLELHAALDERNSVGNLFVRMAFGKRLQVDWAAAKVQTGNSRRKS